MTALRPVAEKEAEQTATIKAAAINGSARHEQRLFIGNPPHTGTAAS
jgi:hypothetical protein